MSKFRQLLTGKASNWAVCLLSGSLLAVAASNLTRPALVSAQAPQRRPAMAGESRAVVTALQDAFVNIAETVEPSVVTISARVDPQERPGHAPTPMQDGGDIDERAIPEPFRDLFRSFPRGARPGGPAVPRPSTGSGVIIREDGSTAYVLTNNHVVDSRDKFRIKLHDETEYTGELVGTDMKTDLAVLKFKTRRPLPPGSVADLGDSDQVKTGQWAIAIGSPLGYESTMTVGVVSAKGRELPGMGRGDGASYSDLIQTDASINPGNSGGALVNINGEVIGINVAIASNGMSQGNIGIGFAIPVNVAKMVSQQLIQSGKVVRGYLGVSCSSANRELSVELREHLKAPNGGALVDDVSADGPAAKAGLKGGDVIVKFGDRLIGRFTDLENAVAATVPGSTVPVEVLRNGQPVRSRITVVQRPDEKTLLSKLNPEANGGERTSAAPTAVKSRYGLSVQPGDGAGVEVAAVAPGSPAQEVGLQPGDVIVEANGKPTPTVDAFQKAVSGLPADSSVVIRVKGPNSGLRYTVIRP